MQHNLFDDPSDPDQVIKHDLGDAAMLEYPQAFSASQSQDFLARLLQQIPWQQDTLRIAGKQISVPRLQCWMGDQGSRYGYSGIRLEPCPWNDTVLAIRERVETLTGTKFNSVLLNYYRSGQDSVAWHSDDEPELGPAPVIASVSFGAPRQFQLKHKHQETPQKYRLTLANGSLLFMEKGLQNNWMHQLPKLRALYSPRVNLTFRIIVSGGG